MSYDTLEQIHGNGTVLSHAFELNNKKCLILIEELVEFVVSVHCERPETNRIFTHLQTLENTLSDKVKGFK